MRKKSLKLQAQIHATPREGAKQPAIEPAELLLMMETLARWVSYDHKHKTFLSKELLVVAARAMKLRTAGDDPMHSTHWALHRDWPLIAFLIGLDTKSFTVVDPIKFKWFWHQLGEKGKFDINYQKRLIASGKEPPEMEPLIVTKPYWTPKVKSQKLHTEAVKEYQNNSRKEDIMDHFFV